MACQSLFLVEQHHEFRHITFRAYNDLSDNKVTEHIRGDFLIEFVKTINRDFSVLEPQPYTLDSQAVAA